MSKSIAVQALEAIVRSEDIEPETRMQAAQQLHFMTQEPTLGAAISVSAPRWYQTSLKDLTVFFLKCVIAATPALMLAMIMYVGFIVFNSVAAQVLGGL